MAPKFRGDGEDWLDDDDASGGGSGRRSVAQKKSEGRASALPATEANGTVSDVYPKLCAVRRDGGGPDLLCSYRRAAVFRHEGLHELKERSPVAVGDRVKVIASGLRDGVVEGICERRNFLGRPAPGMEGKELVHVIAANVDVLVIVASSAKPEFTPGLVDRFLIAAQVAGIIPLICVNKIDLLPPAAQRSWTPYKTIGVELFEVAAKTGAGVAELQARLQTIEAVFCGKSGVGKTSLLGALTGIDVGRVAEVSEATGKGKHTTTGAHLLEVPGAAAGTRWIDTPGVREFGLYNVRPEDLWKYFPDLKCSDRECTHVGETECSAQDSPRFDSYRRIHQSLSAGER